MAPAAPRPARPPRPSRPAEAGVALLIVLVVLFIVAVLMVDITLTATTARRSAHNASTEFFITAAVERKLQVGLAQIRYENPVHAKYSSLDDRWALADFTNDEKAPSADGAGPAAAPAPAGTGDGEEEGVIVYGEGGRGSVEAKLGRVWDPSPDADAGTGDAAPAAATPIEDEDRRLNLYLLLHPNKDVRTAAEKRFETLLTRFRRDTPLEITPTRAADLRQKMSEFLNRELLPEGQTGGIPAPTRGGWRILTPDELVNAPGFEDSSHGLSAKGILQDSQDPRAVRDWLASDDEEKAEPPAYPGLLRYITVWSGDAFKGDLGKSPNAKFPVNLNTAERPVLEALFHGEGPEYTIVQKILDWRGKEKEDTAAGAAAASGDDEPLPRHNHFDAVADLGKVEGFEPAMLERNSISDFVAGVRSHTFSLFIHARSEEKASSEEESGKEPGQALESVRQFRVVVRRTAEVDPQTRLYGYATLLREERDDPWFAK